MRRAHSSFLAVAFILLMWCFSGCRTHGVVVDATGAETSISRLKTSDGNSIVILQGAALHKLPLKEIRSIELYADDMETREGKIFYRAEIVLANGDILPAKARDRRDKELEPKAFVSIDTELVGRSHDGAVRIPLTKVHSLEIE